MPMLRTYRCPSCADTFEFMHHPSDEPPPRYCPLCGYDTQEQSRMESVITIPHIGTLKAKSAEMVYRASEEGAKFRADMARDMGVDDAGADDLKITDMKTAKHAGEVAAVAVDNDVTRAMQAAPVGGVSQWGMQSNPQAAMALAAGAHSGPEPHAGMKAREMLRSGHQQRGFAVNDQSPLEVSSREAALQNMSRSQRGRRR